jgi:DNA-directed RNA polymerase specialized sigma24 family protein
LTHTAGRAILIMERSNSFTHSPAPADKDVLVTPTTSTALEHALQQYGDDLYRLALLLASDEAHTAAALHSAVPRLADAPPDALDELAMSAALVAALPAERRRIRRRLPAWARLPADRQEAPLVAALARLPRQQRLALGLMLLRGFDATQAANVLGADEAHARALTRDALVALAPYVQPALAPDDLDVDHAPADCRPTRMKLALGGDLAHADPAARGHLALCSDCRAAEQIWQHLTTTAENALRGALRHISLPERLTDDLRAAGARTPQPPHHSLLARQRGRLGLVALAVIAVIALLVLPGRRAPAVVSTGAASAPAALAPHELVDRAIGQLYAPPAGAGVWHGRWEIRWSFAGGSYATLNADAWTDTGSSRHRVQLAHIDGGGPFEFELADETGNLWYATTQNYAPSLYPALLDGNDLRARLKVTPDEAQRMLRARLSSGAWDLPAAYLRQAQAAPELHSWGLQHTPDGATLEIISFDGFTPLAQPPDAPDAANVPTTILLAIDVQSGALYEVRELIGPEGGERSSRTTWRFVAGEWLTATQDVARAFNLRQAWNGTGDFGEPRAAGYADPALPLVPAAQVMSLASVLQQNSALWLPSRPRPDAERAVLLSSSDGASFWTVYLGAGRRLVIRTFIGAGDASPVLSGGEMIALDGRQVVLQPANGQTYQARLTFRGPFDEQVRIWISAIGYTRAELLDVLRGFGPPTAESYRAQASLFADPQAHDPAAFDALLGALATPTIPPGGAARHFVERTFTRHSPVPDPFGDPYHLPLYGGRPEELLIENWVRADAAGVETTSIERDAGGTVYGRQYLGPATVWYYDAPNSSARQMHTSDLMLINRINLDQAIVFDLLVRGGSRLVTLPDGTRAISNSQPLLDTRFVGVLSNQQNDPDAGGPYLGDLNIDTPVTTLVALGADGRPRRIETHAAVPGRDSILLETWELVSDEQRPAERIPVGTFDASPPAALTFQDYHAPFVAYPGPALATVTITDALRLVRTPLFVLPPGTGIDAPLIEAGDPANRQVDVWDSNVFSAALQRGMAIRLTYELPSSGPATTTAFIYEGDAATFSAYLRTQSTSRWGRQSSVPVRITIGERTIDGWRITASDGLWTLFELDGTLLAAQTIYDEQVAALARLQPLAPLIPESRADER